MDVIPAQAHLGTRMYMGWNDAFLSTRLLLEHFLSMSTTERMNFSPDQARGCFTKLQEGTEQGIGIDHVDDGSLRVGVEAIVCKMKMYH